jgi:hypothetical protein
MNIYCSTMPQTGREEEVATSDHDSLVDRSAYVASAATTTAAAVAVADVLSSTGTANTATVDEAITYRQFWRQFTRAHGAVELLVISTIFAVGIGSVLGLVRNQCKINTHIPVGMYMCLLSHTYRSATNCVVLVLLDSRHAGGSVCASSLRLCRSVSLS